MATTINRAAVLHIPVSKFAFALNEKTAVLRLRTAKNDLDGVKVFI